MRYDDPNVAASAVVGIISAINAISRWIGLGSLVAFVLLYFGLVRVMRSEMLRSNSAGASETLMEAVHTLQPMMCARSHSIIPATVGQFVEQNSLMDLKIYRSDGSLMGQRGNPEDHVKDFLESDREEDFSFVERGEVAEVVLQGEAVQGTLVSPMAIGPQQQTARHFRTRLPIVGDDTLIPALEANQVTLRVEEEAGRGVLATLLLTLLPWLLLFGFFYLIYQRANRTIGGRLGGPEELKRFLESPATKADEGHDENIPYATVVEMIGAERAAQLRDAEGGDSLTALPIVETQAGDVSAYIPTNVISITDGQIFLETDLFNAGIRPAINAGLSVSRVGGAAQTKIIKKLGGGVRLALAQFRELAAFAQFASDLDDTTRAQLERGERVTELMKQAQYSPMTVAEMAFSLFAANEGYLDDVPVAKIVDFEAAMQSGIASNNADLLDKINESGDYNDEIEAAIKAALDKFKETGTW